MVSTPQEDHMAFVWHCCMLCSKTGVPKLANIYVLEGVHLTLAVEGKNMFIYHSFPIIYAYISEYNGRLNNFFLRETTSALSLPFLGCYRWNANGCSQNTSPFLHPMLSQQSQKMGFVGSHSQVYYDNFLHRLSTDLKTVLLHKRIAITTN